MFPVDNYIPNRVKDRQHRSEAEHRLYWSTYKKMASQIPAPRKKFSVWRGAGRWLGVLRKWWYRRAQSVMRVSKERIQKHPLIPKERQG